MPAGHERAGHDRAEALHREDAVDRQPRDAIDGPRAGAGCCFDQRVGESASRPSPVSRRHRHDRARRRETSRRQARAPRAARARACPRRRGPTWSARRDPDRTRSSRQMSKCSRVCGITDSSAATTSTTRSMPPTPASMFLTKRSWPGTSTNAKSTPSIVLVGEAEVDGDAARLLFLQPIGIGAGQRLHERALAVIDVAGRSDDDGFQSCLTGAAPAFSSCRSRRPGRCLRFLSSFGAALLRRGPRSPSRTRSRISTRPRST